MGIVLPNRDILVGIFQYRPTVMIVPVMIARRGEDGDDGREVAFGCFAVHGVSDRCKIQLFGVSYNEERGTRRTLKNMEHTLHLVLHVRG